LYSASVSTDFRGAVLTEMKTSNLREAHVTHDSSGTANLPISVQHAIE